jgi:tetratricopeptide (TPR) repeat protein
MLGRCCEAQGQPAQAGQFYRQELAELTRLEQSDGVRRHTGVAWTDLADALRDEGDYSGAKEAYQAGLESAEEQGDKRQIGVVFSQLGTLAYVQGELEEAEEQYTKAIALFQRINEPAHEAIYTHMLGRVYQDAKHWQVAEDAYRKAAWLLEEHGRLGGSVSAWASWQQLAQVCEATGRKAEAEQWYKKDLAACRAEDDRRGMARALNNLAGLIVNDTGRLDEARGLAERSLAISETLNPTAAEIWKIYELMARITSQQGDSSQAAAYRAKSRHAYFAFLGWRQQLYQHEELIAAVVQVAAKPAVREQLEPVLKKIGEGAWANLIAAIQRILSGERDEAALCGPLNYMEAAIIRAILEGIAGAA